VIAPVVNALPDSRDRPGMERIRRAKKFLKGLHPGFPERFSRWREIFSPDERRDLLVNGPGDNAYLEDVAQTVAANRGRFGGDPINLMLYLDAKGLLPGDMLTKVDRMSMANSLEVRVPFLDHTVVRYTFGLPGRMKLGPGGGKRILLDTFRDLLPPALHRRPKWGFEMPIGAWLRKDLHFLIQEYLSEPRIRRQDIFRFPAIESLIRDHMSGRRDTSWQLWNLIVFQHWYTRVF
jgi:asparagine synthase (glutamine-hydrolysing)